MSAGVGGGTYGYRGGQGPIQVHHSPPIVLGHVTGDGEVIGTAAREARVLCGESRVNVKLSLMFVRDDGADSGSSPTVDALGATLYVGEEEDATGGQRQGKILCNDIIRDAAGNLIHKSAPLPIPEDPGLDGWSQEFETSADSLKVLFTTATGGAGTPGPSGTWMAKARFQPAGQRIRDEDWDHVIRNLGLTLIGPEFSI